METPPDASPAPRSRVEPGLCVPEGTTLLHIGPPKTATTAVQGAFWAARESAAAQGLYYPGRNRHSAGAVLAALNVGGFFSSTGTPPLDRWIELRGQVESSTAARLLISSEFWADATSEDIARLVPLLRRPNIHVVITLRPLVLFIWCWAEQMPK